ncbi:FCGBP protein, partial [Cochlearius cochlearius]|nr:FCGBP protein [Cochlearius cochlearius]
MVAVPSSYFGATCGLCGNFNEDAEDEVTFSNGTRASGVEEWAESWRDPSCQDDCGDQETPGCGELRWGWGGEVACKKAGCKAHEKCVTVNGVPSCQAMKYFTCIGTGDPHYTTFDGLRYDFQGTCVYQFAALCSQDPKLVPFTVKVENNNRGSKAVSFTKTVTLEVYGNVISMSQEHPRKVKVNGAFVELPFAQEGQFELYHSGVHGFARTAFGLRVSFDWYSYARVILPEAYAGAACGLCGNANGDAGDDFVTRDGKRAADEVQLADSWKVGEVPGCSAGCVGDCPACNEEQKELYRGDGYCGVIARAGGPFRACHGAVSPAPFLEDCAFDACHYKGHRDTLCKAIAAYVTECQSRGVGVEPWRTPAFCGPSCPRHSHYELCGSSCPATCRGPAPAQGCASAPCTEGCFCDEGFVLSGDACVPAGECGCEHGGRYYKKGEDFFASCRERCRCKAGGAVECKEVFCSAHEECRVEEGALGCYPTGYGRLVVSGDPHYVTFDGRAFDLLGSCAYVLARVCKPERRLANFSVLLEHAVGGRGRVALMKKVVISIHGYAVSMERGRKWEVTVSQEGPAPLPRRTPRRNAAAQKPPPPARPRPQAKAPGAREIPPPLNQGGSVPRCARVCDTPSGCTSVRDTPPRRRARGCNTPWLRERARNPLGRSCGQKRGGERTRRLSCLVNCLGVFSPPWRWEVPPPPALEMASTWLNLSAFPSQAGETIISSNCSTKCNCHPAQGLVCEDLRCPPDEVCATRDGAQGCVKRQGQCRLSPGASLTTYDGAGGRLLASGTYKVAALCNEQSPNWFKVVVEVSECRDDSVPAAVAVFIFFREAFITVNNNMEVWVS